MTTRRILIVPVLVAALALTAGACGSSSKSSSSTTTAAPATTTTKASSPVISGVVAPIELTAASPTATVKVGQVVSFSMGDPGTGTYVAVSSDSAVFKVETEGKTTGTSTQNAGGIALIPGTAEVTVSYQGSMNGVGAPTIFTITVTP